MSGYREGSDYLAGFLDRRQVPIWFLSSTGPEDILTSYIHATHAHKEYNYVCIYIRLYVHVL